MRFFHQDYIDELPYSGIRTLYLPMPLVLNEHEIEVLHRLFNLSHLDRNLCVKRL